MFKLALLGVVLVAFTVNGEPEDGKDKCMKVFSPHSVNCCKGVDLSEYKEGANACKPEQPGPPTCDFDNCVAKKMGYLNEDGKSINKEALKAHLKEHNAPEIVAAVDKNCLEGDLDLYGPKDVCEAIKIRRCAQLQVLKGCADWVTEGECPDVKADLDECVASIGA